MKTYRSRVSIMLIVFLYLLCFALIAYTCFFNAQVGFQFGFVTTMLSIVTLIVLFLCFGIKYVIDGHELQIKCMGLMLAWLDIRTITGFKENHNPLSAPAASLKRLYIYYGNGDVINISPRNQEEFIAEINAIRNAK